jgi:AraC family transcriptional regulator
MWGRAAIASDSYIYLRIYLRIGLHAIQKESGVLKEDYLRRIQLALRHIEDHLHEEVSLQTISQTAFSSLSHFHRIFFFMTGMTLKEYIRQRRMSKAIEQLLATNKKIIDIAIESGYVTAESFSRAFKQAFGLPPLAFRHSKQEHELFEAIDISQPRFHHLTDIVKPELQFILFRQTLVMGAITTTTLANHQQTVDIPQFFAETMQNNLLQKIAFKKEPLALAGVYSDMTDDEEFSYTIGFTVDQITPTDNLTAHTLPSGKYARFRVNGPPSELEKAWRYIYGVWMPNSGETRSRGFDFEIYGDGVTDIYIPMQAT